MQTPDDAGVDDIGAVIRAVSANGLALQQARQELRDNPRVVTAAVGQNGQALQYASKRLKNHEGVVGVAMAQDIEALAYASPRIQNDELIVLDLLRTARIRLGDELKRLGERLCLMDND